MKEAFRYSAFEFLLKPIDPDDLGDCINRLGETNKGQSFKQNYEKLKTTFNKLVFNIAEGFIIINPKEIIYIKAEGGYSEIVLDNGNKKIITKKIGEIENQLSGNLF